ncbi:MAG: hypothetical protein PVJ09_04095 [Candidatus Woesebacteria bacterium]|jgi:hypothetical protein
MWEEKQDLSKFVFELPGRYYAQADCLTRGRYKITISVYGKNAKKITRNFFISWSGNWKDNTNDMFKELVIK